MSSALRIIGLLVLAWRKDRTRLTISFLLMLLQSAALPLSGSVLGTLTNAALAGDTAGASIAAIVAATLVIAALTAGHFAHIFYFELSDLIVLHLQCELISLSNDSAGIEHHERPDCADKLQVLREELDRAGSNVLGAVLGSLGLSLAILITVILLGMLNALLLLLPLAAIPPLLLGRRAEKVLANARERAARPNRLARHLFSLATDAAPAKELRSCGLEQEIRRRHSSSWAEASEILWRGEMRAVRLRVAGQLVFAIAYVAATLLIVVDAVAGRRSIGDIVLVIILAAQVNQQLTAAVTLHQELLRVAGMMDDMDWVRALVAQQNSTERLDVPPDSMVSGITFHDVSFGYPGADRNILEHLNLRLPAGSTVVLVGENGAGKSTLVKLLCGFYAASAGRIEVDGVDLQRIRLPAWRARISAGFQDFVKFEFLAREVVGIGHLPHIASDSAVRAALRLAKGEDVIDRLEHGLQTELGRSNANGVELSGGQWQKLALGRAMMRPDPLLLVLDEPTSALDAQAENSLFERFAENAKRLGRQTGAITVLVSHRFSTVRMADQIIVVAGKGVSQVGTHDDLMWQEGLYAELYALQVRAYQ